MADMVMRKNNYIKVKDNQIVNFVQHESSPKNVNSKLECLAVVTFLNGGNALNFNSEGNCEFGNVTDDGSITATHVDGNIISM